MAGSNLEVVRSIYDARNRDDFEGARAFLHSEVEWRTSGLFPGLEPVYRGPEGVREFWENMQEAWERFTIHVERTIEQGDNVVLALRFEGVGRESGVKVELPFAHFWQLEDRLVRRYGAYPSLEEALAVSGLAPE